MKKLTVLLTIFILSCSSLSAQDKLTENFNKLTDEILENLQQFYPVEATARGVHTYDYVLPDFSRKSVRNEISKLKDFEKRLYKYRNTNLSLENKINLKLIKGNVDIALQDIDKIEWHRKNPYMYVSDAVNGIYLILISEHAPLTERVQNVIARLKAVPDLLRQGQENIKNPPPVYIELAQEMTVNGIDFYEAIKDELAESLPELTSEIETAVERAIAAMREFEEFLQTVKPGDENSYAIGNKDFDYRLQHDYFLDLDSDSLLKIGEALFARLDSTHKAIQARLDSNHTGNDSIFVIDCIDKQNVLDYYAWELNQVKQYLIDNDVVTVPDNIGHCLIVETPVFLRNIISTLAYQPPGTFNSDQTGHFYVRPILDTMDNEQAAALYKFIHRRGFKGSIVHEAYPGHHFQFQLAARNDNDVRKWQFNSFFYEGWAVYCEEMMYHKGLYGDNERTYANIINWALLRAARIILDVKLHTGQISREDAVAWLIKEFAFDTNTAQAEVDRYTLYPTIQMSYLMGKVEIQKLLEAMKKKEGDSFSLKGFHDRLLSEGSIPPTLLWEAWGLKQ